MEINSENNEVMNEVVVVIVPFQAQGHLNQLLQFACLISSYGLSVYYVSLASCFLITHNTSKVIEAKYLNMIAHAEFTLNKKQWAIAPILPTKLYHRNNICFEWLNKQPPSSVLYISFEKTTSFSDRQIKELAMGLEQSRQMFIWVLREIDEGDRRLELPEEFEEFMSHYGWNSCIESITMGVPIVAWPIHSDQSRNVFLVMEILKIGLIMREWEKRNELVSASTIENVMRKLMASEEDSDAGAGVDESKKVRFSTDSTTTTGKGFIGGKIGWFDVRLRLAPDRILKPLRHCYDDIPAAVSPATLFRQ
ncbi:putative 65-kDa microtubule-associated protein 6-like [Capsicum annuum]|nr:putative 65-kDa microtubule-associated protein 6-like [Capsicum annuum]